MVVPIIITTLTAGGEKKRKLNFFCLLSIPPNLQGTEDEVIHWSHGQKLHSLCANPSGKILFPV